MARPRISLRERFLATVRKGQGGECWEWPIADAWGYGFIGEGGKHGRRLKAHRVAYEVFIGPIPDSLFVCHRCDNRRCVNPDHLFLGTHRDNMADMVTKKRGAGPGHKGEDHGRAKLTEGQVLAIRSASGTLKEIGTAFGIRHSQVWNIKNRVSWAHI